ncbi:MAG: sensor histidine kinase [Clostridia bacterium]|nr:sensor histidine kinase [Clostridia bacterium]
MPFLLVLETLVYYICLIFISVKILDGVLHKLSIALSFFVYIPVLFAWENLQESSQLLLVLALLIFQVVFLKFSSKGLNFVSLVYSFLLVFCMNSIINSILISFISINNKSDIIIEIIIHFLFIICCAILCLSKVRYKIKSIINWTPMNIKGIVLSIVIIGALLTALILDMKSQTQSVILYFTRLFMILILLVCTTFPIMILNATTNTYLKKLTHDYEEQIKAQAEHYSALAKANFELRRFQHDFKNIKVGVSKLIAEERLTEAMSMLDSTHEDIYNTTHSLLCFDTGNGIVDALLADKQRNAALSNIKIKFEGAVPSNSISATELCVLFGNTIDNAIEACEKIDIENEKIINITCKCNSNFMFLDITNPVSKPIAIKNNTLATTKADKTLHGFGLYSLDQIVRKHNGELNLSCDNYEFKVNISMFVKT